MTTTRAIRLAVVAAVAVLAVLVFYPRSFRATADTMTETNKIGDYVWVDTNGNGLQESTEDGIADILVVLHRITPPYDTTNTLTDVNGYYEFDDLSAGAYYRVEFRVPPTHNITARDQGGNDAVDSDPSPVDGLTVAFYLSAGVNQMKWDAGLVPNGSPSCGDTSTVGNQIWKDVNRDGQYSTYTDIPIVGADVSLYEFTFMNLVELRDHTTTDTNGKYEFNCVADGIYSVAVDGIPPFQPAPTFEADPNNGVDDDNNAVPGQTLDLAPAPQGATNDFLVYYSPWSHTDYSIDEGFICSEYLDIVLLLDSSHSMKGKKFGQTTVAATSLVDKISLVNNRIGVITFADAPNERSALTDSRSQIMAAIKSRPEPQLDSITNYAAGLQGAAGMLGNADHPSYTRTPIIIIFTDGAHHSYETADIIAAAKAIRGSMPALRLITVGFGNVATDEEPDLLHKIASGRSDTYWQPSEVDLFELGYALSSDAICAPRSRASRLYCSNAPTTTQDLSTGRDVVKGETLTVGNPDPHWNVTPPNSMAVVVDRFISEGNEWPPLRDAAWISWSALKRSSAPGATYRYDREFTLPSTISDVRLEFDAYADDTIIDVTLNGVSLFQSGKARITGSVCYSVGVPLHVIATDLTLFESGENTLSVFVEDGGGFVTGLILSGAVDTCGSGSITNQTATPQPTATPSPLPSPTPTPTPTTCTLLDVRDGSEVGGQAGAKYICVNMDATTCRSVNRILVLDNFIDEGQVVKNGLRHSPIASLEDLPRCAICGSCLGVQYCGTNSVGNVGVTLDMAMPTPGWKQGAKVEVLMPNGMEIEQRWWGDLGYVKAGVPASHLVERYVQWSRINGKDVVIDGGMGTTRVWARSVGSPMNPVECPYYEFDPLSAISTGSPTITHMGTPTMPANGRPCEGRCPDSGTPTPPNP